MKICFNLQLYEYQNLVSIMQSTRNIHVPNVEMQKLSKNFLRRMAANYDAALEAESG